MTYASKSTSLLFSILRYTHLLPKAPTPRSVLDLNSYFRRLSIMLLSKSLYFLSIAYYATTIALPLDDVKDLTVAEDLNAK